MDTIFSHIGMSLPVTNPVLIFSLVLFVILFAPFVSEKLKLPNIIVMILAGIILGEHGIGVLTRDSSFELYGTVGMVYIMFLAGIEMDITDFKKNRKAGVFFGGITFILPMVIGTLSSYFLLQYIPHHVVPYDSTVTEASEMTSQYYLLVASLLLASMYASHTLISYPIVSKYGVNKNRSISITIGGTMIATTLSLLVLAVIVGMAKGQINSFFWVRMGIAICIFLFIIVFIFPRLASLFFKRVNDSVGQYIFVLALVFLGGYIAQLAGLEAIIGAFLVGIAISSLIPRISPLMNRLEFVGNAIFIPFFLIGVGMLIDLRAVFAGPNTLIVAVVMCIVSNLSKYLAAMITQRTFNLKKVEGNLIFGLSTAQAAATLAAVKIGYDTVIKFADDGSLIRIFSNDILNGTVIMILVTCVISSTVTERMSKKISTESETIDEKIVKAQQADRILVPLYHPDNLVRLMELAVILKAKKSKEPLYALHVADDSPNNGMDHGRKLLERAARIASATDNSVKMISRYDTNVAMGMIHTIKENNITDIVLGLHHKNTFTDSFFGEKTEKLLQLTNQMVMVVKAVQPLSTIRRVVVAVPPKAQFEIGFVKWYDRVKNICKQIGASAKFFAPADTLEQIKELASRNKFGVPTQYEILDDWDEFLILTRELESDNLLVIVSSRKNNDSYLPAFEKLPQQLGRYFADNSFIILYPEQFSSPADKEIS